jgi:glycosyltransferase involved in cell wall biosynthesis
MKQVFIIISNGFGGIKTYENNITKFLKKDKKTVYFIGEKNNKNNFLDCDTLYQPIKTFKNIIKIKKNNTDKKFFFLISNPLILIIYFFPLNFFFKKKKIILTIHSHIFKMTLRQLLIGFISSILSIFIDSVIFVSKFTQQWWFKYFFFYRFSKNKIIYNFIFEIKKLKKNNKTFNIGFVGRTDNEKGFEKYEEIANYLKNSKINFLVFGNKKNEQLNIRNIKLYGWQNKKNIYQKIHLLLVTSPIENCPFTVLEAKSYGIPTLSISDGGIKEIIKNKKDGILLSNDCSLKKIVKNIFYIKKNYNFYSTQCFKNITKFSYRFQKKNLLNIF